MKREKKLHLNEDKYILIGTLVVFSLFFSIITWGIFAKIDTVIPANGKVVIKSYKKPVELKNWGTVSKVFVSDGDIVKEGQLLLELEKIKEKTDFSINKNLYYSLLAKRDRLLSQKKGLSHIVFSKEFENLDDEILKNKIKNLQTQVFNAERKTLQDNINLLKQQKEQLDKQIEGLNSMLTLNKDLLNFLEKRQNKEKNLIANGLADDTRLQEITEKIKSTLIKIEDTQNNIELLTKKLEEINKQIELKKQEYMTKIVNQLEETQTKLSQIKPQLNYSKKVVEKTFVKAPYSGQIIGLKIKSKGQVVKPGETIAYIVPKENDIFIQVKIDPQNIDKVKIGQFVDLQFPSFLNIASNVVEGKVIYVSSDTLFDEISKTDYYEAHIIITPKGYSQLKEYGFNLIAGMPATAFIKVEKISPFEYILQPIIMIFKTSFVSN